jgi:hypothetical protein
MQKSLTTASLDNLLDEAHPEIILRQMFESLEASTPTLYVFDRLFA